jgi:hypothetical protein
MSTQLDRIAANMLRVRPGEPGAGNLHAGFCVGLRQANMEGSSGMNTPPH